MAVAKRMVCNFFVELSEPVIEILIAIAYLGGGILLFGLPVLTVLLLPLIFLITPKPLNEEEEPNFKGKGCGH